jgi:hypothetical protein
MSQVHSAATPAYDAGKRRRSVWSEKNSGPEDSLEGGDQTTVLGAALLHPERVGHLGPASESDSLVLGLVFLLDPVRFRVHASRKHGYKKFTIRSRRPDFTYVGERKLDARD